MKSVRQIMLAICVIFIASAFAGCGVDADLPEKRPALEKIEYTNLNDSVSQKLLEDMLSGAGVSEDRIQGFFNRVDSFNESMREEWLTAGFEQAKLLDTKYDPYEMQDEWVKMNGSFPGYNCRITAMELFGDFVSAGNKAPVDTGEDVLFMDEETLKTSPDALGGSSLTDFRALYSSMRAEDTEDVLHHVQAVQEEWRSRGISFRENERTPHYCVLPRQVYRPGGGGVEKVLGPPAAAFCGTNLSAVHHW
ncbi:MAG: DUF4300 family protein [Oscillospiraceae bacterium]